MLLTPAPCQALELNGIMLLTAQLRISRPNNYQPTVGGGVGGGLSLNEIVPGLNPGAGLAVSGLGGAVQPGAGQPAPASFLGGAQPAAAAPAAAATALCCANMVTGVELHDTGEREGLKEDVAEECKQARAPSPIHARAPDP